MTEQAHEVARRLYLDGKYVVQCTCGEKFKDITERAASQKQFFHGVQAARGKSS